MSRAARMTLAWAALLSLMTGTAGPAGRPGPDPETVRNACLNALGRRTGAIAVVDVASGRVLAAVPGNACEEAHPPGSLAKLATAHAGLLTGRIRTDTSFECRGALRVAGRVFHCSIPGGHGRLTLPEALAQSCNIWFYQAGRRVGSGSILRSWRMLGVPVSADAASGVSVERLAAAGEGVRLTPLQMALLCRTIALKKDTPGSPCGALAAGMEAAVTGGTARALDGLAARPAGKTGSPEHSADPARRHGWFAGYAPRDRPSIAFAVFCLDGNAHSSAVPVAERMLRELFPPGAPQGSRR